MTDSQFTDEDLQAYATTRAVSIAVGEALAAELLSCRRDARRYQWICNGNGYYMEEQYLCGHTNEKDRADAAIDREIADEQSKEQP